MTTETYQEFLKKLREKLHEISSRENNVYPGYGFLTIGQAVQAYLETVKEIKKL